MSRCALGMIRCSSPVHSQRRQRIPRICLRPSIEGQNLEKVYEMYFVAKQLRSILIPA